MYQYINILKLYIVSIIILLVVVVETVAFWWASPLYLVIMSTKEGNDSSFMLTKPTRNRPQHQLG